MKTKALVLGTLPLVLLAALTLPASAQYVTVGDPGNPNDSTGYGAVATTYAIGTYEVTLNQYAAFLNAKAVTDTFLLYNTNMGTNLNIAGISRTGSSGSYVYGVIGTGTRPVTYVSFYDAMRYANWLNNGGGSGDTETGGYTLLGGTATPSNGLTVARNGGAQVWVPSENEWYKAAYYQPAVAGGDTDGYWLYPTGSNAVPNSRNGSGSDANSGNFYRNDSIANGVNDGYAVTNSTTYSSSENYLTPVGAFTQADSYYGTFDQGGNVWEWNDTIFGSSRLLRGGEWFGNESSLRASVRSADGPTFEGRYLGFRVATVPEPTSAVILSCGALMLLTMRRRTL